MSVADDAPPPIAEFVAPAQWRAVDLLSDLHLGPATPRTMAAWAQHMLHTDADAVLLLGDVFEAWVGDDAADVPGFEAEAAEVLARAAARRWVGFMAGNRDFLLGDTLLDRLGVHRLHDPTLLRACGHAVLLSHGDLLCLDDVDYQRFRREVRGAPWQSRFLAQPLARRRELARQMRDASQATQRARGMPWAEVDAGAAIDWLHAAGCPTLVHGHTHRPADHALAPGLERRVLSDWDLDLDAEPTRAEVMRLSRDGLTRVDPT